MLTTTKENGFTLIEVMIAIVVLSIGIFSTYHMQVSSIQGNANASRLTGASTLALDQIEQILSWDFADPRFNNNENITPTAPVVIPNSPADNSRVSGIHTVYWDGTPRLDPVNGQQVGIDVQVHVTWADKNQQRVVTMLATKLQ
jgi:prepilin-type N-terminal cleavage/methylation domain-containing protein